MIPQPARRAHLRRTLIIIILATMPCYLLGLIVLWISNSARDNVRTPTVMITLAESSTPAKVTPTLPVPLTKFPTATITDTPTNTLSPTITSTYFIPSSTPTETPTPTNTATFTATPTETTTSAPPPEPSLTPGVGSTP